MTLRGRAAYNGCMTLSRLALVSATVVLVAAVAGGTTARPAASHAGASAAAKAPRLVAFRSCGDLLGYVKSQAVPLVGPWGFGGSSSPSGCRPSPARRPRRDAGATPTEGVDYSGTNVQEQGVDEPDLGKTNGTTLFAVAGGRLERRRRQRRATAPARLAEARRRLEP